MIWLSCFRGSTFNPTEVYSQKVLLEPFGLLLALRTPLN
jgi:hypothetical protein